MVSFQDHFSEKRDDCFYVPSFSPFIILGIVYSYKDFPSHLEKALCLSDIVTVSVSHHRVSVTTPTPALSPLVMLGTPVRIMLQRTPFSSTVSVTLLILCYFCFWCLGLAIVSNWALDCWITWWDMPPFCFQPSALSPLLDCNGEGPAFIFPLAADS